MVSSKSPRAVRPRMRSAELERSAGCVMSGCRLQGTGYRGQSTGAGSGLPASVGPSLGMLGILAIAKINDRELPFAWVRGRRRRCGGFGGWNGGSGGFQIGFEMLEDLAEELGLIFGTGDGMGF